MKHLNIEGHIVIKNLHHTNSLIGYLYHKFEDYNSEEIVNSINDALVSKVYSTGIEIDLMYSLSKRVIDNVIITGCEEDDYNKTDIIHAIVELHIRKVGLGKMYAKYVGEKDKKERVIHPYTSTIAKINAAHQIKSRAGLKQKKVSSMAWLYNQS